MLNRENHPQVPDSVYESLVRYVEKGVPTGGFLYAVLSNNLKESLSRADSVNRGLLYEIVNFCYNEIPSSCWGSEQKVNDWISSKGLSRLN